MVYMKLKGLSMVGPRSLLWVDVQKQKPQEL